MVERLRDYPYYFSAAARINEFLALPERDDQQKNLLISEPIKSLSFEKVVFGYEQDKPVLNGLDLHFQKESHKQIFIFDEADNALDANNRQKFQQRCAELARDKLVKKKVMPNNNQLNIQHLNSVNAELQEAKKQLRIRKRVVEEIKGNEELHSLIIKTKQNQNVWKLKKIDEATTVTKRNKAIRDYFVKTLTEFCSELADKLSKELDREEINYPSPN
ncbi:11505_t:CDS:2, partial [Racocetra persica]